MPVTTYFNENDYKRMSFIKDEINDVFQEVRRKYPNIYVERYVFKDRKWWGKTKTTVRFSVFNRLDEGMESQCLRVPSNFLLDRDWET